jgi:subtilisin family serine protease
MKRTYRAVFPTLLVCLLIGSGLSGTAFTQDFDEHVQQQIKELIQEKEGRTGAQKKLASRLVYAIKAARHERLGTTIDAMPNALTGLDTRSGKGVLVDIRGAVSSDLEGAITKAGGEVIYSSRGVNIIHARVPIHQLEKLAGRGDVSTIRASAIPKSNGSAWSTLMGFNSLGSFLPRTVPFAISTGSVTSQGMIAHSAGTARTTFGVDGTGVKVGVLSDSAEQTAFLIGTGDLPADTVIVQDIIGSPGSSEGTAMMEIVHDMAPGAQLFFASAFNGEQSFADNIRTLRNTYHCDVIVDDVSYSDEAPFQDSTVALAVDDVVNDGAIYFSSAANSGNLTSLTSSAWEADFVSGGTNVLLPGYTVHSFGPQNFNRIAGSGEAVVDLFWSDPLGGSSNDYDLFILNSAGTAIVGSSTDIQSGTQDPFEEAFNPSGFPANSRIVIAAKSTAQPRALHVRDFFGVPLQIATSGNTVGHNAGPSTVSVAAVAWNSGRPLGIKPFTGGVKNPTETFSSDGPRKMFFNADGTAITPGNFLFGTNGGTTFVKPDIAAADGVSARTPGFSPFFGTSAAAPHAAGIAALAKSLNPALTNTDIYNAMTSTALDIRAPGIDRDSGFGIVMAPQTLTAVPH